MMDGSDGFSNYGSASGASPSGQDDIGSLKSELRELEKEIKAFIKALESAASSSGGQDSAPPQAQSASQDDATADGATAASPVGGGGGGGGDVPQVSGSDDAQAIADDLRSKFGLDNTQIAGVLGNLQQESGLSPDVNQGGAKGGPSGNFADDNQNGWGLAQWGGARKQGEVDFASQHGLQPGSMQANLGYMNQELSGPYSQTISDLKNSSSTQDAARAWDQDYEQATDPQMSARDQYAQNFQQQGL